MQTISPFNQQVQTQASYVPISVPEYWTFACFTVSVHVSIHLHNLSYGYTPISLYLLCHLDLFYLFTSMSGQRATIPLSILNFEFRKFLRFMHLLKTISNIIQPTCYFFFFCLNSHIESMSWIVTSAIFSISSFRICYWYISWGVWFAWLTRSFQISVLCLSDWVGLEVWYILGEQRNALMSVQICLHTRPIVITNCYCQLS